MSDLIKANSSEISLPAQPKADDTELRKQFYRYFDSSDDDARQRLRDGKTRLVHYTSSENALKIIRSAELWLRSVRSMNDYSEVQHGINLIIRVFQADNCARRDRLSAVLNKITDGAAMAAFGMFDSLINVLPNRTFVASLSECSADENVGRLSMWRAYSGGNTGVALVLNSTPFTGETDKLGAYSVAVSYLTDEQFANKLDSTIQAIEDSEVDFTTLTKESISQMIMWWLVSSSVGLKHPAFIE